MITITELAKSKIMDMSESEGIGHFCVRVKIIGGGCSGYQFDMIFDDQINDEDEALSFDDVKMIIDQLTFQYIGDITIDYVETLIGEGFKFSGGNISSSCGCGNSVSF